MITPGQDIVAGTSGGIARSSDNGDNWSYTGLIGGVFALIRSRDGIQYAGTSYVGFGLHDEGILRSTDEGYSWSYVLQDSGFNEVNALVESNAGSLFAGTDSGVFRSSDDGNSWQQVALFDQKIHSLLACPGGVVLAGSKRDLFRSTDDGSSWTRSADGLTSTPIWDIEFDQMNTGFAASAAGVFRSTNTGMNWTHSSTGLPTRDLTCVAAKENSFWFARGSAWRCLSIL